MKGKGDSVQEDPFTYGVNCFEEDKWGGNTFLPQYVNTSYDETEEVPSLGYIIGHANTISFPVCIDTGATKSLMSSDLWKRINATNIYELKPQYRGFQAVNGSKIGCQGSAIIQLMIFGEKRNYVGYVQFHIVDNLSIEALLGMDEIFRHGLRINTSDGFARQDKVGKLIANLSYKTPYDVGVISADENITCYPMSTTSCKIRKIGQIDPGESIIEPIEREQAIIAPGTVITESTSSIPIINTSNEPNNIVRGTPIARIYHNASETVGVVEHEEEEEDEEAVEMGMSIEPDNTIDTSHFGLQDSNLTEDEISKAKSLITEYRDLFMWGDGPLSCTHKYKHEIKLLPGAKPVKHKTRRFSTDQTKIIDEEMNKLIRQGIVEKSSSAWNSRIVLAYNNYKSKPRVCLDLRDLNSRSQSDQYPIPNLQDLLQKLVGCKYFSCLDLYAGFHQFELAPQSREYTAFQTSPL